MKNNDQLARRALRILHFIALYCFCFTKPAAFAQQTNMVHSRQGISHHDSMLVELLQLKEDTNRVMILVDLCNENADISKDEALSYGQTGLQLAKKLNWNKGIMVASLALGNAYKNKSDYPKAFLFYTNSLQIARISENKYQVAVTSQNIGSIYFLQGDYTRALLYYDTAKNIYASTGDSNHVAAVTINISAVYLYLSNYPKAMEYDLDALKIYEKTRNKYGIADALTEIGNVFENQKDDAKALEYYFKALKMQTDLGNKNGLAVLGNNIGGIYSAQKDYKKALDYYFEALKTDEQTGNKKHIARVTNNIGLVYDLQKEYGLSIKYYREALQMNEEIGTRRSVAINLNNIGSCYLSITPSNNVLLKNAISYLDSSRMICDSLHEIDIKQDVFKNLAKAYKIKGDFEKALEYTDSARVLNDTLFSKENNDKIVKLEMKDQYERQKFTDSLKNADKIRIAAIELQKQETYKYMGLAGILLLAGFSFFIVRERNKSEKERQRSEDLLLNILPVEVATELKANGASEAKQFDDVTVIFTDFVNFTHAGERMSPQELVNELHICFIAFDKITSKYDIEKIKTIGDAYMAVCGLPVPDPKHAENCVMAAIEIRDFIAERYALMGDKTFQIRIGIHSGSVVAGIVGVKKFAYDIWGDTVNIAARMEQKSEPGKINISETTYELVKDKFNFVYRGEIAAKNKGAMKMYFVENINLA